MFQSSVFRGAVFISILSASGLAFGQDKAYPPVTWRLQNQSKNATITEAGVVFTAKDGQKNTIGMKPVSVGPGGSYDMQSQDGPCFVKIEGVIRFIDGRGKLRPPMMKTIDEPNCIVGVRYMQLIQNK